MRSSIFCFSFVLCVLLWLHCQNIDMAQDASWPDPVANQVLPYGTAGMSHGPLLGAVTDHSVRVWVRTRKPTDFEVLYSKMLPLDANCQSVHGQTTEARDQTGVVELRELEPNTRFYYAIRLNGVLADLRMDINDPWPSFKTLPNETTYFDVENNPKGNFNVTFAIGHCASQDPDTSGGMYGSTPAFDLIARNHREEAMFAIVNGDVIYEEQRDGTLDGVRENYKLYFSRGRSFARLFRSLPGLFTFDDHDVGWDIHGSGQIGLGEGRHLIRDVGLRAYEEYLSWANYPGGQRGAILFGQAQVTQGGNVLFDPQADFSRLDPATISTIHLGNYTRDAENRRRADAPKNAGVYGLQRVLDANRLEIQPATRSDERLSYSIGTHHYYDWRIANCHFFALDTRGERSDRNPNDRTDPSLFILSEAQEKWLVSGVQETDAQFIFLISPDPWVIYHTSAHVGGDDQDDKGDGFPSFLHQRERLIEVFDAIAKPILIFTGDVHTSASVKITDNVWEMMCGPLGSTGHPVGTLGNPPRGGAWKSMGRDVAIRWLAGFPNNLPYQKIRNTFYGVVQVNNVLQTATPIGQGYQYCAYDEPQVIVRWHDGYTGRLAYAESITVSDAVSEGP